MTTDPKFPLDPAEAATRLLCEDVAPVEVPDPAAGLSGLLARVGRSVAAHAGMTTVRARQDRWQKVISGVRKKLLWDGPEGSSVLLQLDPGVRLPVHRHAWLEEGICLAGGLQLGDLELGPGDYHVSPPGSRHGHITSCPKRGALAYLRGTSLGHAGKLLGELVGGLWPGEGPAQRTVFLREGSWEKLADGVDTRILWLEDGVVSRYVRLRPGASLPAHDHAVAEECMMIEGEAFFGDILVQAGDFHLAPAGTRHGAVVSEGGALLFVRGAAEAL